MSAPRQVLAVLLLVASIGAQRVCWEQVGVRNQFQAATLAAAVIGDADGDGWRDLVASTEVVTAFATGKRESQLWTLSSRDGSALRALPPQPSGSFQRLTGAGDIDGDGCDDYAVGINNSLMSTNAVEVRSGRDDRLLWEVQGSGLDGFGSNPIVGGLDLNGDGGPDLVVSAPGAAPFGELRAFDTTGATLWVITSRPPLVINGAQGPQGMARAGDVDGDGGADLVVGSGGPMGGGSGVVISGRTGAILVVGYGQPGDQLGYSVDGAGDVDADGVPDFVAGNQGNGSRGGVVAVFSGATGERLREWTSLDLGIGFAAHSLRGGLDFDQDGVPDVVVGSVFYQVQPPGGVFVLSGRDGRVLYRTLGPGYLSQLGRELIAYGAAPGSPFPRFVTLEGGWVPYSSPVLRAKGRVAMYCGEPRGVTALGPGCAGSLPGEPRMGLGGRGDGVRIHLSGAPPSAQALLLLGTSSTSWLGAPLPLRLDPIGLVGCRLLTSIDVAVPAVTGAHGIDRGYAFVDVPAPLGGGLGITLHGQWLVLGAGASAVMSNALTWGL